MSGIVSAASDVQGSYRDACLGGESDPVSVLPGVLLHQRTLQLGQSRRIERSAALGPALAVPSHPVQLVVVRPDLGLDLRGLLVQFSGLSVVCQGLTVPMVPMVYSAQCAIIRPKLFMIV
jgi:hypothetical protein